MVMPAVLFVGMLTIATPFTSPVISTNPSISTPAANNSLDQNYLDQNYLDQNYLASENPALPDSNDLEPENPVLPDPTDRLFLANITNPQDARDFLEQMRSAATTLDPEALAELVHYPFTTYNNGRRIKTYATPAELLLDFQEIFTPRVITAMQNAQYSELFVNAQGAMISSGTVWFFQYPEGIKIKAINRW